MNQICVPTLHLINLSIRALHHRPGCSKYPKHKQGRSIICNPNRFSHFSLPKEISPSNTSLFWSSVPTKERRKWRKKLPQRIHQSSGDLYQHMNGEITLLWNSESQFTRNSWRMATFYVLDNTLPAKKGAHRGPKDASCSSRLFASPRITTASKLQSEHDLTMW